MGSRSLEPFIIPSADSAPYSSSDNEFLLYQILLFYTSRTLTDEIALAGDGVYAISQTGSIQLVDLKTNITTDLVQLNDVRRVSSNIHLFSVRVAEEHG